MRIRYFFVIVAVILFLMSPLCSWGQEQPTQEQPPQEPKLLLGGFDSEGTISWGYRFTTIKGDRSMYENVFNLHSGARITDINLTGRAPEGSNLLADFYSLSASGLGGDPFANGQLVVRKNKLYDLRVNFRQSRYFWSQNNIDEQVRAGLGVPVASGGDPSGYTKGLTANHSWATTRRMGSVNLNIRATDQLQFSFEYDRNSRTGTTLTTRGLYFEGSPCQLSHAGCVVTPNNFFGSSTRDNPYLVFAPLDEFGNRITGGVSYSLGNWGFNYHVGYESFVQNTSWENMTSPQQSINRSTFVPTRSTNTNADSITKREMVADASWSDYRRTTTPISEFSYTGKVNPWLELRGSYNYHHYTGPGTSDGAFAGDIRTNSSQTTFGPYSTYFHAVSSVDEPVHIVKQGFTAKIRDWWNFNSDYQYSRVTGNGEMEFSSVYNGIGLDGFGNTLPAPGQINIEEDEWIIGTHLADVNMEFLPRTNLVVRTGIRYVKRDVEHFIEGVSDRTSLGETVGTSTQRTKSVLPTLSVYYKPVKQFSVRADLQSNTSTRPYTRVSPQTDIGSRFVFRFQPSDKISIEDNLVIRSGKFKETSYESRYRSNALNISYNFSEKFSLFGGFSYESIFGRVSHRSTSTTYTFNGFWQDAFINRGFQGGLTIRPVGGFGIDLSGNYLRTTGASRLFSTVPTAGSAVFAPLPIVWPVNVGPLTFPTITGTFYYDFPTVGRLSFDLQRSYYAEEIVSGNNFSANMLMIRWTKFIRPKE